MIVLILARLLDAISTLLNVNQWGWDVEGNPLMRTIGERGLFIPYQLFITGIIIVIAELIPRYRRIVYLSVSSLSLLAILTNLYCFFFIK